MSYEIIKYDTSLRVDKASHYRPLFAVVNKKIYTTGKWSELFQILLFSYCYKPDNLEKIKADISIARTQCKGKPLVERGIEESPAVSKFAPNLYVRTFYPTRYNCEALERIIYYTGQKDLDVYLVKYSPDEDLDKHTDENVAFISSYAENNRRKKGSTKHLVAHINGKVLSEKEKFYRRIEKEFDNKILIGDIKIDDSEEEHLKTYMFNALHTVVFGSGIITHKKVFAYGLVRVALKHYASKTFWPYVRDEYGIDIPGYYHSRVNEMYRKIMLDFKKPYDDSVKDFIQNICMHAFVCDRCADQFFDYMFDFWRIDLSRSIENCKDGSGNDLFDILIEEVGYSVQDIMIHTTMALRLNPKGCKTRFRRILRMIDNSYWNDADYSNSQNRITQLFNQWKNNPDSSFAKEIRKTSSRRGKGRGEKLLSRPTLIVDPKTYAARLVLPKQILRNCTEEEHPVWFIKVGLNQIEVEPTLLRGRAFLFTEECQVDIDARLLFEQFEILLQSEKTHYYRRTIGYDNVRFFNKKNRSIEIADDYISRDVNLVLTRKNCPIQYLNGRFTGIDNTISDYDVYILDPVDGDIIILPDNKALSIGRPLVEGIISNHKIKGVQAVYDGEAYDVSPSLERIFFKTSRSKLNGTSIKIFKFSDQTRFGRVVDNSYVEFKLDDQLTDVYGYIVTLEDYLDEEGIFKVELSIPGCSIRTYRICCIPHFDYQFAGSPYIFKEHGKILLPAYLHFTTNEDWSLEMGKWALEFMIDENTKDGNDYVKNHQLLLAYRFSAETVDLVFDLPVLYWKYSSDEDWFFQQPEDTTKKDLPKKIYIDGSLNIPASKMHIGHSEDYEESEISVNHDKDSNLYYFRTVDVEPFLTRDKKYRSLYIKIDDVEERFFKIACRSDVRTKSLSGDFKNNRIYGYFDIFGNSDYMVTVKKDGILVEEDIPLKDGKFEIECNVEEGIYTVHLYEVEEDESGFGSVSYELGVYTLELIDVRNFEGNNLKLISIRNRDMRFAALMLNADYYVTGLRVVDYNSDIGDGEIYTWLHDNYDHEEMSSFVYYRGMFGFLNKTTGRFTKIAKAIIVFDNYQNAGEALINIVDDDEYSGLAYSPDRGILQPAMDKLTRYEQKRVHMIDDDVYRISVQVGGKL